MNKSNALIEIYSQMSDEDLQEEIDAFFEIGFALLEVTQSDSIETFPNPNIKLKISCDVIKDNDGKFYC
jgi:hypothetical protein